MGKLRFVFGPSGSGKTTTIYKEVLSRAAKEPSTNFLIIVPDQFTMQTQWDLANMSTSEGILNVDVLSFGRLTHRIMQEVGWEELPVLDDTGKCLVLQRVASRISDQLPRLGSHVHRQGYIHEVKSVLSEFMQYGLSPEDVEKMIAANASSGALGAKLNDLKLIYKEFNDYIAGHYITREEKLDILRQLLPKSAILPGSVICFDGFTGFTPIQISVIADLMEICDETIVSLVLGKETKIEDCNEEQSLFYLSAKTHEVLCKCATDRKLEIEEAFFCDYSARALQLDLLEQNLFRNNRASFSEECEKDSIHLSQMSSVSEEVHQVGLEICRLLREDSSLKYCNIAMVTGNLEDYAPYVEREFTRMGIPFYLDRTNSVRLNPLVEYIKSALAIYLNDFNNQDVFHFLRSGMSGLDDEEIDALEQYVNQTGIRGKKKWHQLFSRKTSDMAQDDEKALAEINEIREKFVTQIDSLDISKKSSAADYVEHLYDFLVANEANRKLNEYAAGFANQGDAVREKEYLQIYKKVCEVLEQIISLMGEDEIVLKEFCEILEAGIAEIRVGTIPQTVDKVMVGDIERSRVSSVSVLFFLGVNDGNIPKNSDKGGIISDLERENIRESGYELAPTPREEMYTQRLYLYLNMTKPTRDLYISWAELDPSGKSLRPSYICDVIRRMYPNIKPAQPEKKDKTEQIVTKEEGLRYLADELRRYVETGEQEENASLYTIYAAYADGESKDKRLKLTDAAFSRYEAEKIDTDTAQALYCIQDENDMDQAILKSSISQLEAFASCPYKFFLEYGLGLYEQESFEVDNRDTGIIYHEVLEAFSAKLKDDGIKWSDFTDDYARENIKRILEAKTDVYGAAVFQDTERTRLNIIRLERALVRTIITARYQIKKSSFEPKSFEVPFRRDIPIDDKAPNKKRILRLRGKIDRLDTVFADDILYVRVIDYKSSEKKIDLNMVYDGQQIQLPIYLSESLKRMEKSADGKYSVLPAGMLYSHIDAPILDGVTNESEADLEKRMLKEQRFDGYITADDFIAQMMDEDLAEKPPSSVIVPVGYRNSSQQKGVREFNADSKVLSLDDVNTVMQYSEEAAKRRANDILDGNINIYPTEKHSCEYCSYKKACGFDKKIPGYEKRKLPKYSVEEVLELMKENKGGN